jgi:energy-coupling factor transporter ATP-binding protein EcfA2
LKEVSFEIEPASFVSFVGPSGSGKTTLLNLIGCLDKPTEGKFDATSYLLGIRYLTPSDTTFIFEYYRNGTGYTHSEVEDYFSFIDRGYDLYLSTGNDSLLKRASGVTQGNHGRPNPGQDYLYLRVTQKEPFNILYFTPGITTIMNLDDRSFQISPEFLYTGFTNWEFRLKGTALVGQSGTEFGEKANDYKIELRVRYYF